MLKTRFAPSPTGYIHVGNARTALFNALLAYGGDDATFLLRIEDTDEERSDEYLTAQLIDDLRALGIQWQEGYEVGGCHAPYAQSQRSTLYQEYIDELVERGFAYPCFCTPEELHSMRLQQKLAGIPPRYDGRWRNADAGVVAEKISAKEPFVMRFKVPEGVTQYDDLVKGKQRYDHAQIGDFILTKKEGMATFFFANAIDDSLMGVTHVLRGDDHLTNTPRQLMILKALNMRCPEYGHMSTITGSDGKPLSKRNGSASIRDMLLEGWLPLAIVNYFARLGHHYADNNLLSFKELAKQFSINHLSRSNARYDIEQLQHWQKLAVVAMSDVDLLEYLSPYITKITPAQQMPFVKMVRNNIVLPNQVCDFEEFIAADEVPLDDDAIQVIKRAGAGYFDLAISIWLEHRDITIVLDKLKQSGLKGKALFMPLRLALTGMIHGPEISKITDMLEENIIEKRLIRCKELIA